MEKEDISLPVEMGKLEIEPAKYVVPINSSNPFVPLSQYKNFIQRNSKTCSCGVLSKIRKNTTKKKKNKVLKEPVLKLLQSKLRDVHTNKEHMLTDKLCRCNCSNDNLESLNLSALVYDCNKLKISSDNQSKSIQEEESAWCKKVPPYTVHSVVTDRNVASPSCSQQALNPPCDITIDELASYFETMVHIPKKMSSMAEMMYI